MYSQPIPNVFPPCPKIARKIYGSLLQSGPGGAKRKPICRFRWAEKTSFGGGIGHSNRPKPGNYHQLFTLNAESLTFFQRIASGSARRISGARPHPRRAWSGAGGQWPTARPGTVLSGVTWSCGRPFINGVLMVAVLHSFHGFEPETTPTGTHPRKEPIKYGYIWPNPRRNTPTAEGVTNAVYKWLSWELVGDGREANS